MNWFRRWMTGRNGSDQLSFAILVFALLLFFLGSIFRSSFLSYAVLPLLFLCFFRMFSKNYEARRRENAVFMRIWYKLKNNIKKRTQMFKDKKTHRFFKCPSCKKTLRVPKGKGMIFITCPKCGERFTKKT